MHLRDSSLNYAAQSVDVCASLQHTKLVPEAKIQPLSHIRDNENDVLRHRAHEIKAVFDVIQQKTNTEL